MSSSLGLTNCLSLIPGQCSSKVKHNLYDIEDLGISCVLPLQQNHSYFYRHLQTCKHDSYLDYRRLLRNEKLC